MPEPSFLSWGSTPHRTDTVNTLLKRIAGGIENGGGGGGGSGLGQIKYYISDPNIEGVVPDDQTKPAIATKQDGSGSIVTWNTGNLQWN